MEINHRKVSESVHMVLAKHQKYGSITRDAQAIGTRPNSGTSSAAFTSSSRPNKIGTKLRRSLKSIINIKFMLFGVENNNLRARYDNGVQSRTMQRGNFFC